MSNLTYNDWNDDTPTDTDLWLKLYDKYGSRMTAYTSPGHLENIIDELLWRMETLKATIWAEGFDAGERDVWNHSHEEDGWDSDCIKNPYKENNENTI